MTEHLVIRDAEVLDGTGSPARRADVLVSGGVVVAVEDPGRLPAGEHDSIDARGLTVAPGFIDVHSHADNAPFLDEDDTSKILQGVTTEVVGNCGFSLAPRLAATGPDLEALATRIFPELPWAWSGFGELLAATDARGYVTNYAPLVGHHALRVAAMGMSGGAPDDEQLALMGDLLDEAMDAGAFGLSSGLIYPPGQFARTQEIVELARRLPAARPYVTHMRGEGSQLLDSIAEAVAIGEGSGRRVHISHLKTAGRSNWGRMGAALDVLDEARTRGLDVRHDIYPYTAGSTMLTASLPPWFQEGGAASVLRRLVDPADLDRLREQLGKDDGTWENHIYGAGWDGIVVASSASHEFDGRSLARIAGDCGTEPFDALVRVLLQEELKVSMIVHSMHEDDLARALGHELTMVGSDGLPPGVGGKPHPRMYGTFPRILARYSRELGILDLPEAVRRMTSLAAESFGVPDRGVIAPGKAADLVAFDPATVRDRADYTEPTREPEGISWVMVNGELVVRDGRYLGRRGGRRLVPAA
ncbi:MAG: N-acyl-D-amino-acid deacylase [Actinoallomurus sp.]|nr:N-acyl-D-amino-acid deacylase [Actinoallomurus sp.]